MKIVFQLFRELIGRFPIHFSILLGLVLCQAFFGALTVVAIAPITDFLLDRTGSNVSQITSYFSEALSFFDLPVTLLSVFIFFAIVTVINGIIAVFTRYAVLRVKYDVLIHLLVGIMGDIFRARLVFFSENRMGLLLNSFQQEVNKVGDSFGHIVSIFANIVQILVFLAVPFALSPKLTAIFLGALFILGSPLYFLRRYTYKLGRKNTKTGNALTETLYQTLTAAKLILAYGRQALSIDRYDAVLRKHSKAAISFHTLSTGVRELFVPVGIVGALVAIYAGYMEGVGLGEMAMVLFAFMKLIPILATTIQGKTYIEGFIPAYEQINHLRQQAIHWAEPTGGQVFTGFKKNIELSGVSFGYPGRDNALNEVNIKIQKNSMTALVGESGAGKTTVVDLILGLYAPNEGAVYIDGKKLDSYNLTSFRSHVGYVPQEPFLFDLSVRDNLLWSAPDATEYDLVTACKLANADQFLEKLPEGLNTQLGDRGVRLSGGQRQRLALARALLRKPQLLVLDEATSALDSESEKSIQLAVEALIREITIVVIAHRLSTVRLAEYVYVLSEGKVEEVGSYSELAAQKEGRLAEMIRQQRI